MVWRGLILQRVHVRGSDALLRSVSQGAVALCTAFTTEDRDSGRWKMSPGDVVERNFTSYDQCQVRPIGSSSHNRLPQNEVRERLTHKTPVWQSHCISLYTRCWPDKILLLFAVWRPWLYALKSARRLWFLLFLSLSLYLSLSLPVSTPQCLCGSVVWRSLRSAGLSAPQTSAKMWGCQRGNKKHRENRLDRLLT